MFKCGFFIEKHVFLLFFDSLCSLSIYEESFMLGFMWNILDLRVLCHSSPILWCVIGYVCSYGRISDDLY